MNCGTIEQSAYVRFLVDQFDGPPTRAQQTQISEDERELSAVLERFAQLSTKDLANLNGRLGSSGFPFVGAEDRK